MSAIGQSTLLIQIPREVVDPSSDENEKVQPSAARPKDTKTADAARDWFEQLFLYSNSI